MLHVLLQPHGSANCKHATEALATAVPVLYAQGSLDIPQALTILLSKSLLVWYTFSLSGIVYLQLQHLLYCQT